MSPSNQPARILWVMRNPIFVRNFEAVLRELAGRGHHVHVAFEADNGSSELITALAAEHPTISTGTAPVPHGPLAILRRRLRSTVDLMRYYEPEYARSDALRARARDNALWAVRRLPDRLWGAARARGVMRRVAGGAARLGRPPRRITDFVAASRADLLLVSPLTHFASPQPDYIRAATRLGVPSALALFSWDNLTNKGLMHELPDGVLVWNEDQAREAVEHHGVPRERITVTGAAAYDHWFRWRPTRDRAELLAALGLDPEAPLILYLCSSAFIARDEPAWVARWVDELRAQPEPLGGANVIVRPHPQNADRWRGDPLGGRTGVAVFPALGEDPTTEASRASYFDSIHHSALVVGINTTAIVESAIMGRRSFTVRLPEFAQVQEGTLHFQLLREQGGGPLRVADSMAEHMAQLADGLREPDEASAQLREFVRRFVRPRGLDMEVAPIVADRVEELARRQRSPNE